MPNCFQLYKKGSDKPEILSVVDVAICQHLGIPVHTVHWAYGWYNSIGFTIAMNHKCKLGSAELREKIATWYDGSGPKDKEWTDNLLKILSFLEDNYTSEAWVQIGR